MAIKVVDTAATAARIPRNLEPRMKWHTGATGGAVV